MPKKGFATSIIVLIIALFAGIGISGYIYFQSSNKSKSSLVTTTTVLSTNSSKTTVTTKLLTTTTKSISKSVSTTKPTISPLKSTTTSTKPPPTTTTTRSSSILLPNVFIVQDDGTMIQSGYVDSDIGPIDVSGRVTKAMVIKKFFQDHPDAKNIYDFLIIATAFKPGDNIGEFQSTKNITPGTGDSHMDTNLVGFRSSIGLTGEEKFQGYAFITNVDNVGNSDLYFPLHEVSHRWLFYLGDYDSCGKGFGCTLETGFKINKDGGHYNDKINTTTIEGNKRYRDPNGGGSLQASPTPGYCSDSGGGGDGYRFTNLDLYLMGLIPAEEVTQLKWYQTSGNWIIGKGISCVEKTFTVQDVINMVGPRNLAYPNTQRDFSVAYILLTQKGQTPTNIQISKINYIADNFPKKWAEATKYKSTINGVKVSLSTN